MSVSSLLWRITDDTQDSDLSRGVLKKAIKSSSVAADRGNMFNGKPTKDCKRPWENMREIKGNAFIQSAFNGDHAMSRTSATCLAFI